GTAGIAGTSSTTVNRVVGRVDANAVIDTSTTTTAFNANNIRGATSSDGTSFWMTGANGSVQYETFGSNSSTQLSTTTTNLRAAEIFVGQLYVSSSSGSTRIATIGGGEPTTSGQAIVNLPGIPTAISGTNTSPYEFFLADLTPAVAGVDTLYVADDTI